MNALRAPAPFATAANGVSKRQSVMSAVVVPRSVTGPASAGLAGLLAAATLLTSSPAMADIRLPPLDTDPNRCERAFVGNTIGQANAVSDKVLDLRYCDLRGKNLTAKTLSGALLADTDLSGANLSEAVMSKAYAVGAKMHATIFTNAVIDRVAFEKADLTGAQFINSVLTGCTYVGADLSGANFEDALIGNEDAKRLCQNPTLTGESRDQVGCRGPAPAAQ